VLLDPWYGPKIAWEAMFGAYWVACASGNVAGSLGFCVVQEKKT